MTVLAVNDARTNTRSCRSRWAWADSDRRHSLVASGTALLPWEMTLGAVWQGALLALISSGLTIIYGTLGVLNLAHGAMFMLGGYAGGIERKRKLLDAEAARGQRALDL